MSTTEKASFSNSLASWVLLLLFLPIIYVLSSGPVMGLAFWLREATGRDQFYVVMYLYYPLFSLGHDSMIMVYIEWWVVDVFHTVGPG